MRRYRAGAAARAISAPTSSTPLTPPLGRAHRRAVLAPPALPPLAWRYRTGRVRPAAGRAPRHPDGPGRGQYAQGAEQLVIEDGRVNTATATGADSPTVGTPVRRLSSAHRLTIAAIEARPGEADEVRLVEHRHVRSAVLVGEGLHDDADPGSGSAVLEQTATSGQASYSARTTGEPRPRAGRTRTRIGASRSAASRVSAGSPNVAAPAAKTAASGQSTIAT